MKRGLCTRDSTPDTTAPVNASVQPYYRSPLTTWASFETAKGTFSTTVLNQLQASVNAACNSGTAIGALRVTAGINSPAWLTSHAQPVPNYSYFVNDPASFAFGSVKNAPLLNSVNLRTHYLAMIDRVVTFLKATDVNGHPNHTHVYSLPVALPANEGTEMSMDYGSSPAFLPTSTNDIGCPKTETALDPGGLTFDVDNVASWPEGRALLIMGVPSSNGYRLCELMQQSSRTGKTVTLVAGGRGWGTPASASTWPVGTFVRPAIEGLGMAGRTGSLATIDDRGGFGTRTGLWDMNRTNFYIHERIHGDGGTSDAILWRQGEMLRIWDDAVDEVAKRLVGLQTRVSLAGGGIYRDGWKAAIDISKKYGEKYGPKLTCGITNLRPDYDTWASSIGDKFLVGAMNAGTEIWLQSMDPRKLRISLPAPYAPYQTDDEYGRYLVIAGEKANKRYRPRFIEYSPTLHVRQTPLVTTAEYEGWPGGTHSPAAYLLEDPYALQNRMPELTLPPLPTVVPTERISVGVPIV